MLHDLEKQGLLVGIKDHVLAIGKCDRCKTIVEPRLSTQWFVAVNRKANDGSPSLAERAIQVAEDGRIRFIPENYKQVYLNWMTNIHDWCISRQLWWGHRIPAWHCARVPRNHGGARSSGKVLPVRQRAAGAGCGCAGHLVLLRTAADVGHGLARQNAGIWTLSTRPRC